MVVSSNLTVGSMGAFIDLIYHTHYRDLEEHLWKKNNPDKSIQEARETCKHRNLKELSFRVKWLQYSFDFNACRGCGLLFNWKSRPDEGRWFGSVLLGKPKYK